MYMCKGVWRKGCRDGIVSVDMYIVFKLLLHVIIPCIPTIVSLLLILCPCIPV